MPVLELEKAAPGGSPPPDVATACPPGGILCRGLALPGHRCVPNAKRRTTLVTVKGALKVAFQVGLLLFFLLTLLGIWRCPWGSPSHEESRAGHLGLEALFLTQGQP